MTHYHFVSSGQINLVNHATFYWRVYTNPGEWSVMYGCVWGIDIAAVSTILVRILDLVNFVFHFINVIERFNDYNLQFKKPTTNNLSFIIYFNMISFFRFVNKRASYPFGIISLAHAPVNVIDFSIGSINCERHFLQTYI